MVQATIDQAVPSATIWSVYRPIEAYRELLPASEEPGHDPAARLQPLDAYLIHQLLNLLPTRPILVDLAADATWGATAVLGLTHPRVRQVIIPEPNDASAYRFTLERYCAECDPAPAAALEPLAALPGTPAWTAAWRRQGKLRSHVFLLPIDSPANRSLIDRVRDCLEADSDSLVMLLGLGWVGQCRAVQSLLEFCGTGSDRRFWLLRELGDCLHSSELGLVAGRANGLAESTLKRLQQLYTTNFNFLDLVKKTCRAAIQAADVDDEALKTHPTGWLVQNREVVAKLEQSLGEARDETHLLKLTLAEAQQARTGAQSETEQVRQELQQIRNELQRELQQIRNELMAVREEAQQAWHMHGQACADLTVLRQALWEKDQQLAAIQAGLIYRLADRIRRVRQWLIPEGSRRFRCYWKLRRAASVGRSKGLGLLGKLARKCWPG